MDFSDPRQRAAFFEIHQGLPREGPGEAACTLRALALAAPLPQAARVLDVACGPGAQTLDLAAALPGATITALDAHPPFLAQLDARAAAAELSNRITTVRGDMAAMDFAAGSFDLIWCEGAAYIMGVENALKDWKRLLAPGGALALTEAVWLAPDPPPAVAANWEEYPAMGDAPATRALFAACGYRLIGDFVLPGSAWMEYYGPMEARLNALENGPAGDAVDQTIRREAREEIACYRRFSDYFGYAFLVGRI